MASADVKLENISNGNPLPQRINISESNKEKEMYALSISNEYFEFISKKSYSHESLALGEFPKSEGLDDNNYNDSGSDDDNEDSFSL